LYERGIAEGFEAVNLAGLDDENVAGAAREGLAVDGPEAATFADELDLVVGVTIRGPGPEPGLPWKRKTETGVLPCSAPTNSCELPTKGRFSWRT